MDNKRSGWKVAGIVAAIVLMLSCGGAGLAAILFGHSPGQKNSALQQTKICVGNLGVGGGLVIGDQDWLALGATITAVKECFDAVVADISAFQSQGVTVNIKKAQTTPPMLTDTETAVLHNCTGTTALYGIDHPFSVETPVVLQVGAQTYSQPPGELDSSADAMIARALISKFNIPIGTHLVSGVTLSVVLPAHTEALVTVTVLLDQAAGTASESDLGVVVASGVSWGYPTAAESPSVTGIDIESCH